MPTSADRSPILLLDTSAAIALVDPTNIAHAAVSEAVGEHVLGLAGHAAFETYSVLTRMPPPRRLRPEEAQQLIETNFPETRHLDQTHAADLVVALARAGVAGGAVYDALVGAAALFHHLPLLTCDRRAKPTYRLLGVQFRLVH